MAITTRSGKGSALTHSEMDTNLNQIPNGSNSSITDDGNGTVNIGMTDGIRVDKANNFVSIDTDGTAVAPSLILNGDSNTGFFRPDSDTLCISTGGTERMRIDNAGYLRLAGGGIQFNGDTSTDNALDDYEEGTWTPVCDGITPTTATGTYTKIGNICYIGIFINIGSQSSTASAIISGFPFTVKYDNNSTRAGLSCSYTTLGSMSTFLLSDNSSLGHIRKLTGSIYNWSEISSTVFHIGGTYQTT